MNIFLLSVTKFNNIQILSLFLNLVKVCEWLPFQWTEVILWILNLSILNNSFIPMRSQKKLTIYLGVKYSGFSIISKVHLWSETITETENTGKCYLIRDIRTLYPENYWLCSIHTELRHQLVKWLLQRQRSVTDRAKNKSQFPDSWSHSVITE